MIAAHHRAYVLRWARTHWRNDNSQPRDMDELLERTAKEIELLGRERTIWATFSVCQTVVIVLLVWLLVR